MKLRISKIKRLVSLLLIFLLFINSFMSYASDNDGSAFITKAEFDSIKNNFQNQINEYDTTIDSKIDNAISTYLAGIQKRGDPINLFLNWKSSVGSNPIWIKLADAGSITTNGLSIMGALSQSINVADNLVWDTFSGSSTKFYCLLSVAEASDPIHSWGAVQPNLMRTDTANKMFEDFAWGTDRESRNWNSTTWPIKYKLYSYMQQFSQQSSGAGKKWLYQKEGGRKYLKYFCPTYYVQNKIEYYGHSYKFFDFGTTQDKTTPAYFSDNGKAVDMSTLWVRNVSGVKGSIVSDGTRGSDTATTNWNYLQLKSSIVRNTDDKIYLNDFFSITSDRQIYVLDEEYQGENGSPSKKETYIVPDQSFANIYYSQSGGRLQNNVVKGPTFTYEPVTIRDDATTVSLSSFCNEGASNLIGEDVYHGGGMPIVEVVEKDVKFNIELKLKSVTNLNCQVSLATDQFNNGSVVLSKLIDQQTVPTNQSSYYVFPITPSSDGYIWIFIENITNDEDIEIEDILVTKI